jgi:hypothetical protein
MKDNCSSFQRAAQWERLLTLEERYLTPKNARTTLRGNEKGITSLILWKNYIIKRNEISSLSIKSLNYF